MGGTEGMEGMGGMEGRMEGRMEGTGVAFRSHAAEETQRAAPLLPPREEVEGLGRADDEWET
jgi:hypothetical protein